MHSQIPPNYVPGDTFKSQYVPTLYVLGLIINDSTLTHLGRLQREQQKIKDSPTFSNILNIPYNRGHEHNNPIFSRHSQMLYRYIMFGCKGISWCGRKLHWILGALIVTKQFAKRSAVQNIE